MLVVEICGSLFVAGCLDSGLLEISESLDSLSESESSVVLVCGLSVAWVVVESTSAVAVAPSSSNFGIYTDDPLLGGFPTAFRSVSRMDFDVAVVSIETSTTSPALPTQSPPPTSRSSFVCF